MKKELPTVRFWRDKQGQWHVEVRRGRLIFDGKRFIKTPYGLKEIQTIPKIPSSIYGKKI